MPVHQEDYGILHHTLGFTRPGVAAYRNHFVAGTGHSDLPAIQRLCDAGLMCEKRAPSFSCQGDRVFVVTEKGKQAAEDTRPKPPKISRSKRRYLAYLEYSECFDSFRDFLSSDIARNC